MKGYIDFAALKASVSIEEVVTRLNLKMAKSGNQLRGMCPQCKSGGDRALCVTPSKGLFVCFANDAKGGDQIQLAAHIRGVEVREAAEWLAGTGTVPVNSTTVTVSKERAEGGFQPLDYLDASHVAVEALGFEPEVAKALGVGYAPKGILRGTVAIPVRLEDGSLAGYIGITEAKLPTRWHLPGANVIPLQGKKAG